MTDECFVSQGRPSHRATAPRLMAPDEAATLTKPVFKRIVASGRFPAFLVLTH